MTNEMVTNMLDGKSLLQLKLVAVLILTMPQGKMKAEFLFWI